MIIITEIRTIEVDRDVWEMHYHNPLKIHFYAEGDQVPDSIDIRTEIIKGRKFFKPGGNGEEICIGTSEKATKVIGIQYEAWDNLNSKLDREKRSNFNLNKIVKTGDILISKFLNATFFQRLMWVFTGVRL